MCKSQENIKKIINNITLRISINYFFNSLISESLVSICQNKKATYMKFNFKTKFFIFVRFVNVLKQALGMEYLLLIGFLGQE